MVMQVSRFQDLVGRLVARNTSFFLKLGRLETRWMEDAILEMQIDRPIYVAGLARSGSTVLLDLLASHSDVASHQYKDFPLVHTPFWWNWFLKHASSGKQAVVERAHKDRIHVSPDSPEAMEEILWMAFLARSHDPTVSNVLSAQESNPDFEKFYRDHIRKILLVRGGTRYIAKGNYNISRLGYISRLFPDARFLIPVRDPVGHIASLMKQHRLFCDMEARDPKVLAYMQRAGHFEFGLDRRPINFGCHDTTHRIENLWSGGQDVMGWAAYWSSAYSFVADLFENDEFLPNKMLIVHYGDFCKAPAAMLQRIYSHCELEVKNEVFQKQASRISAPSYYTPKFSKIEIEIIREETSDTVERIQRLFELPRHVDSEIYTHPV